jgi:hypothetical protein
MADQCFWMEMKSFAKIAFLNDREVAIACDCCHALGRTHANTNWHGLAGRHDALTAL